MDRTSLFFIILKKGDMYYELFKGRHSISQ